MHHNSPSIAMLNHWAYPFTGLGTLYIVAIAYVYVIFMIAVTDKSIVGGIITFVLLGLFPLAIFLWVFGTPARRRAKIAAEREAAEKQAVHDDTKLDQ
jgi:hypothetical protein